MTEWTPGFTPSSIHSANTSWMPPYDCLYARHQESSVHTHSHCYHLGNHYHGPCSHGITKQKIWTLFSKLPTKYIPGSSTTGTQYDPTLLRSSRLLTLKCHQFINKKKKMFFQEITTCIPNNQDMTLTPSATQAAKLMLMVSDSIHIFMLLSHLLYSEFPVTGKQEVLENRSSCSSLLHSAWTRRTHWTDKTFHRSSIHKLKSILA